MPSRLAFQYSTLGHQPGNSGPIDVEQFRHLYLSLATDLHHADRFLLLNRRELESRASDNMQ
jgi:hypothetical protein